jgi:hypothetical protein
VWGVVCGVCEEVAPGGFTHHAPHPTHDSSSFLFDDALRLVFDSLVVIVNVGRVVMQPALELRNAGSERPHHAGQAVTEQQENDSRDKENFPVTNSAEEGKHTIHGFALALKALMAV